MKCDVCDRNLTDQYGISIVGISIQISNFIAEEKRVEKLFGKKEFNVCYVCLLKSLGVKEK